MKRVLLGLTILATLGLCSEEMNANMKIMRDGLIKIQDGFLYNSKDGIEAGIEEIKNANKILNNKESIKHYLEKDKQKFYNVTLLSSQRLEADLDQMKVFIESGDMLRAAEIHADVVSDCTRCHAIVRRW